MSTNNNNLCVDPSRLTLAIFGAIFGTLLLCTGFALALWYLVRNHQFDKLLFPEAAGKYNNRRKKQQQKTENEAEAAQENNTIEEITSTTQKEFKNEIVLEMNEINKTTKIVEIKSPQAQQQPLSPREEEIYGTAEDYQIKRPPKIKEKNFEKINEENNRKMEEEEEKIREEEEKKKVEDEVDKTKKTEISNGKKFMSEIAAAAVISTINGNSKKNEAINEIKQQQATTIIGSPKNGKLLKEEKLEKIKEDEEEYLKNNLLNKEKINGWTENNKKEEENEENIQQEEELVPEHLRSMLSEEQFGMLEANKRRLEQERRQLRELGVIF
ncbi:unnamed protein product [Meloidogyne enterolobii]|uniref:Uncharacterized protein n=1 Tax=Meloidogyne enterolobii TaxID=390850 RepID=A0ACB0XZX1_MELEN